MTSGRGAYLNPKADGKPSTLGLRIRAIRVAWGWTQGTLAKVLGSSQSIISEWEKDISKPSGATLTALAKLVDLPVAALENGRGFRMGKYQLIDTKRELMLLPVSMPDHMLTGSFSRKSYFMSYMFSIHIFNFYVAVFPITIRIAIV